MLFIFLNLRRQFMRRFSIPIFLLGFSCLANPVLAISDNCQAVYSQEEQTLSLPCVDIVNPSGEVLHYAVVLQEIPETEPTQFKVAETVDTQENVNANNCQAVYTVAKGIIEIPCINDQNVTMTKIPSETAESLQFVVTDTKPIVNNRLRRANRSGTAWSVINYGNNENLTETLSIQGTCSLWVALQGETERNYDFVTIYNENGQEVRQLSGPLDESFTVDGSSIRIRFTSDSSVTKDGFSVQITRKDDGCNGNNGGENDSENSSNGTSFSLFDYRNNENITETLSLPGARTLQVTITGETERNYDWLKIYDSNDREVKTLSGNLNENFQIEGSSIRIHFQSDGSVTKDGFTVRIIDGGPPELTLESCELVGPTEFDENTCVNYRVECSFSDGNIRDISPYRWREYDSATTIDDDGQLCAQDVSENERVRIKAYVEYKETFYPEMYVTVKNKDVAPLPAPNLHSPNNEATGIDVSNPSFSWDNVSGATHYQIVISQFNDFRGFSENTGQCDSTCFVENTSSIPYNRELVAGTTYYWKVKPIADGRTSTWSQIWSFTSLDNPVTTGIVDGNEYIGLIVFPEQLNQGVQFYTRISVHDGYNVEKVELLKTAIEEYDERFGEDGISSLFTGVSLTVVGGLGTAILCMATTGAACAMVGVVITTGQLIWTSIDWMSDNAEIWNEYNEKTKKEIILYHPQGTKWLIWLQKDTPGSISQDPITIRTHRLPDELIVNLERDPCNDVFAICSTGPNGRQCGYGEETVVMCDIGEIQFSN
jgi:flagellar hook assembly protein FlgD